MDSPQKIWYAGGKIDEAFDKGFASAWTKFVRNSFMGLNQTMRYGLQHVLLSDEMSEFNARAQFRKFKRLEEGYVRPGVPSGLSNEFTNPAKQEFQKANSAAEARRLLPAAMSEAATRPSRPTGRKVSISGYPKSCPSLSTGILGVNRCIEINSFALRGSDLSL